MEQPIFGHKLQYRANRGLEVEQMFHLSCGEAFWVIGTQGNDPLPQRTAQSAAWLTTRLEERLNEDCHCRGRAGGFDGGHAAR